MRKFRVLIFAAIVAALVVPVGFALSIESGPFQTSGAASAGIVASMSVSAPIVLGRSRHTAPRWPQVSDGASLFGLGTLLIGLAVAVRRAR
jgi:hypothetical protein